MKIALAADHAGYSLKEEVKTHLLGRGLEVLDLGTHGPEPVDYPDYAEFVGNAIVTGRADRAILVCGSGVGVSVAANKHPGVRAGLAHDHYSAHQGVEHDDMNVLCIGARVIGPQIALELVDAFVNARFSHEERHQRRLGKLKAIEAKYLLPPDVGRSKLG
ncbi:MAG TPA: ribose 5-phosphate isomerase B [Myxococcaceae bacterium]|nr:ribose 5-phosphate isomerase B [Myxococcaceae bacterium]